MDITVMKTLRAEAPSSQDLQNAIGLARQELKSEEKRLKQLEGSRRDVLVHQTDEDLDAHDKATRQAIRQVERNKATLAELEERFAAAEAAGEDARLTALAAEAQQAQRKGLSLISKYETKAREIARLLLELEGADERIREINDELRASGRDELVLDTPSEQARPLAPRALYDTSGRLGSGHQAGVFLPAALSGEPIFGVGHPFLTQDEHEAQQRAQAERARRDREDPRPSPPVGTFDGSGRPADGKTARAVRRYEEELAAWRERNGKSTGPTIVNFSMTGA